MGSCCTKTDVLLSEEEVYKEREREESFLCCQLTGELCHIISFLQ